MNEISNHYDVIVVGLGAHGSSAIAHLSERGLKCLGLEQYTPVHINGSSHGRSRIIRQAYFEDPKYVPLLQRSFQLWRNLEEKCKNDFPADFNLLKVTGGLMIGTPESDVIKGTLQSVQTHNLSYSVLTASEIRSKYKVFNPSNDEIGIFEEEAGYLIPENCILAYQHIAKQNHAELHFEESMESYKTIINNKKNNNENNNDNINEVIEVRTNKNKCYYANKIVLTVGAWAPKIYGKNIPSALDLHAERRVLYWLKPQDNYKVNFQVIITYI